MSNSSRTLDDQVDQDPPPPIGYTVEGGGSVATCKRCGWAAWKPTRQEAETVGSAHVKCRSDLVKLHARLARSRGAVYRIRPA